jgi:hypothetical protein
MKPNEFDDIISSALEVETRRIIEEQIEDTNHLIDSIKSFQSFSGLLKKITEIENIGGDGLVININGVTPEELVDCCGGDSLGKVQTNLMQGLHHDLEENGFSENYDIDIDTQGDVSNLNLMVRITPNDDEFSNEKDMSNEKNMNEVRDNGELTNTFGQAMYEDEPAEVKDTNPQAEDDKEVILGDEVKEEDVEEQWQAAAGAVAGEMIGAEALAGSGVAPVVQKVVSGAIGNKITDALGGNEEVDEQEQTAAGAMSAEEDMNESKKNTITLSEGEMGKLLGKIIAEAIETPANIAAPSNGVPGIDVTRKAQKDSGKENNDALKAVEKKIKDYLGAIEGTDKPEGLNPEGQGEEKVSVPASDSQEEEIEMNRGRNPADLTYDNEPGETFKERAKLSLVGAAEMGNSHEYANVVNPDSKVGENIAKSAEKRKEIRQDEPIYDKEAVPVKKDDKKQVRPAVDQPAVANDIKSMKQMTGYKEKTQ